MDVRQFAFLARQPSAAVKSRSHFLGLPKRGLALILANAMFWQPLLAQADGIVVSAPGTGLAQAGNGVPIVNIAAPNANGLSHNQFHDYNVGANGVILNNATGRTQSTQLGGIILGNPNFHGTAANIILNEVNGGSPSQLRGYTEVAGQSAHVIVANPYGISCNGCGFINTPQVTLTTGKAVIENGQISRYQVDKGNVAIEGAGLNASNVDQFEIITRATTINAQIQAKKLTIVAGRNDVDARTLNATARAADGSQAPDLAIDSSALGGMYVGAVKLVGTEAGVGVRLSGDMVAGGDIQIDAAGNVVMGQTSAGTAVNVKAQSVEAKGAVYAGTDLAIKTQGALTNQQTLAAKDSITLDAGGRLTNNGIIEAGVNADNTRNTQGDVRLTAQALDNTGKTVIASRDLSVTTGELANQRGTLSAQRAAQLTATQIDNQNQGRILSAGSLGISADQLLNSQGGLVTSTGNLTAGIGQLINRNGELSSQAQVTLQLAALDNVAGLVSAVQSLNLNATGPVNNQHGTLRSDVRLDLKAGHVDNSEGGRISGGQVLNADVASLDQHNDGRLFGQGDVNLDLNRGHLNNSGGVINAPRRLLLSNLNSVDNQGGEISSSQAFTLAADTLNNRNAKLLSEQALTLRIAQSLDNTQGLVSAKALDMHAGSLNNNGGTLSAGDGLLAQIDAALDNRNGKVLARTASVTSGSLDNRQGLLQGDATLTLNSLGLIDNRQGTLFAGQTFNLTAGSLDNSGGKLTSDGRLTALISAQLLNQTGLLSAVGQLQISAASLDNSAKGNLYSQAGVSLDLNHGHLNNSGGLIHAPGALLLSNLNSVDNSGGEISSAQALAFDADSLDNRGGKLLSEQGLLVRIAQALDNTKGLVAATGLDLRANSLVNAEGSLKVRDDLKVFVDTALDNRQGEIIGATTTLSSLTLDNSLGLLQGDTLLSVTNNGIAINHGGRFVSGQQLNLSIGQFDNSGGSVASAGAMQANADLFDNSHGGRLLANGAMQLTLGHLNNQQGTVRGDGNLTLQATTLNNDAGRISSGAAQHVTTTGALSNVSGELLSAKALTLNSASLDNRGGKLIGDGAVQVTTGSLNNQYSGRLTSAERLDLTAGQVDNRFDGQIASNQALTASVTGLDQRGGGKLYSLSDLSLDMHQGHLNNAGGLIHAPGHLLLYNLSTVANQNGEISSENAFTLAATSLDNSDGKLLSDQALTLKVDQALTNVKGLITAAALNVQAARLNNLDGQVMGDDSLDLTTSGALFNSGGTLGSGQRLNVTSASLDNSQSGSLVSDGSLTVKVDGLLDNQAKGGVLAKGAMDIQAGSVDNRAGRLSGQNLLTLRSNSLDNRGGAVRANQDLNLHVGQLDNRAGVLNSKQALGLTGQSLNNQNGGLVSAIGPVRLNVENVENGKGRIASQDDLEATVGVLNQQGGEFVAQGSLTLTADSLNNRDKGLVAATKALKLNTRTLDNRGGEISSQQSVDLSGQHLDNSGGKLLAGTALALAMQDVINQSKGLVFAQNTRFTGASLDNTDGTFGAQHALALNLSAGLDNTRGKLSSEGSLDLAAQRIDNTGGSLSSAGPLAINSATDLINTGGTVESAQSLKLVSSSLDNANGLIKSQGAATLTTGVLKNAVDGRVTSGDSLDLTATHVTNSGHIGSVGVLNANLTGLTQLGGAELLSTTQLTLDLHNGELVNAGLINAPILVLNNLASLNNQHGEISSQNAFTLAAKNLDNSNGKLISNQALTLRIEQVLANVKGQVSAASLNARSAQLNNADGLLSGRGGVDISATESMDNQRGSLIADGALLLTSAALNNRGGEIAGKAHVTVNAASVDNQNGKLISTDGLELSAATLDNRNGLVGATKALKLDVGSIDNRAGELTGNADVSITGQQLNNSDKGSVFAGGALNLAVDQLINRTLGELNGQRLTLTGTSLDNSGGKLLSQRSLVLDLAGDLDNSQGVLSSEDALNVKARSLDNNHGSLSSAQDLNVAVTGSLGNQSGKLVTDGNLTLRSAGLGNQQGTLSGKGSVAVTTGVLNNQGGRLNSGDTLALTSGQLNNGGSIGSQLGMTANVTGLDQQGGTLFSNAGLSLDLNNGALNNTGGLLNAKGPLLLNNLNTVTNQNGEISSGQAFTLAAQTLDNSNGKLLSNQGLILRINQALSNVKGLIGGASLDTHAAAVDNRGGTLSSRSDLQLTSAGLLNNADGGLVTAAQVLTLQSADLNNRNGSLLGATVALNAMALNNTAGGLINSKGSLRMMAASLNTGDGGEVSAKGALAVGVNALALAGGRIVGEQGVTLDLNNSDLDNHNGLLLANGPLTLKNLRDLNNRGGEISSQQSLSLTARNLDNTGGKLISSQALTLNAASLVNSANGLMSGWQGLNVNGGNLDNRDHGTLSSRNGAIDVRLSGALQNNTQGAVVSQGRLDVRADSLDNRGAGVLSSGTGQTLAVTGALVNGDGGLIESGAELEVQAATLANQGSITAQHAFTFTGTDLTNNGGSLITNGRMTLDLLGNLNNSGGKLASTGPLLLKRANQVYNSADGQIVSQSLLTLFAGGLDNSERGTVAGQQQVAITTGGVVQNHTGGLIYSEGGDVQLHAAGLNNAKGSVLGQTGLTLDIGGDVDNHGGTLASLKGVLDAKLAAGLNNRGGVIQAQGLNMLANRIDNQNGRIVAQTGDAVLSATTFANAKGLVRVAGQALDNSAGQIAAGAIDLSASGALTNRGGVIESDSSLNVAAASVDNQGGQLRALGNGGKTNFQLGGVFDNRNGRLETANTDLTLNAAGFQNQGGSLLHAGTGTFDIATANLLEAGGDVVTRGGLTLAADTWTNSSVIQAGRLTVNVNSLNQTAGGQLLASDSLTGTGGSWTNDGLIASDGTATLTLSGAYAGNGRYSSLGNLGLNTAQLNLSNTASVAAGQDSTIKVNGPLTNAGRLTSAGNMRLTAGSVNNTGTLAAGADLTLTTGTLVNNSHGLITSGGDMQLLTSSFTNAYADVYGLGDVLIAKDPNQGKADLLDNRSGTIESVKNLTINAMTVNNVRDVLEYSLHQKSSVKITELPCGQIAIIGCDYRGSNSRNGLWQIDEIDRLTVTQSSLASSLSSGADLQINAQTLNNLSSTIAATGNLAANADTINNQGVQAQEIKTTRTLVSYVKEFAQTSARVANFNARNAITPTANVEGELAYAIGLMWGGERSRSTTTTNSDGASYDAIIQAGGNVALNAVKNINNSVVRPYYAYVAAGRTKEQTGAGSGHSTAVSINAQLRPDLAQQQVNPISLPGFTLPAGQNGLFRLSGQGATQGQAAQGNAGQQSWTLGGASVDLAQRQQALPENSARTLQLGNVAHVSASTHQLSVAARTADGIDASARAVNAAGVGSADDVVQQPGRTTAGDSAHVDGIAALSGSAQPAVDLSPVLVERDARVAVTAPERPASLPTLAPHDAVATVATQTSTQPSTVNTQTISRVQGLPARNGVSQAHKYLIETNPVLTDMKQFMSSDYLLSGLGYNPDESAKRLGDGFYEQRLIQQAVVARTGQRFIDGQTTDEKLFKHLMDNAIASKQTLNLAVGVSLSSEQVAALTHDIVWLEKSVVNGEEVLVPVLYLANANNRLAPTGALIAGNDVSLIAGQDLNNVGTLRASNNLSAKAGNDLVNSGLIEAGNRLDLLAGNNIVNKAGGIIAGRDVTLTAVNGDVINERTVTRHDSSDGVSSEHREFLSSAARIEAANDLSINAGRDVSNQGSVLDSGRDTTIQAGRDLSFGSVEQVNNNANTTTRSNSSSVTQNGSSVTAGRDLSAKAGRDLTSIASQMEAKRDVAMAAGGDLILASAADEQHAALNLKKVKAQEDHVSQVATSVKAGGDVVLSAGKDLALIASRVSAGDEAYLSAGANLALQAAANEDYSFYSKVKKSSSGKKSRLDELASTTNMASSVTSGTNATLVAGNDLIVKGSEVAADKGAAKLVAGNDVQIVAVTDSNSVRHESSKSKSSWGGLKSSKVQDAVSETQTMARGSIISGNTVDVAALHDVTVKGSGLVSTQGLKVQAGRDLVIDAAQNTFTRNETHKEKNRDLTGVLTANNLGVDDITGNQHLSISSQNHTGQSAQTTLTGSTVGSSQGNVVLTAGRELSVIASDLVSTKNMSLTGANVNIAAGMESASQSSTDKSSSLAVGRVVGGAVVDTFNSIRGAIKAANNADDPKLKAVKLAQAALAAYNLNGMGDSVSGSIKDYGNNKGSSSSNGSLIKIGTETALTHSKRTSEYESHTAKQSSLNVGQALAIESTGKAPGTVGDIHVIGSSLKAAETALIAKNDITLESAQNTADWANNNANNRKAIGASFNIGQQNGFTIDLGAQIAKGMGTGSSATQVNTTLDSGALTLHSGKDTTLDGAQVRASKIDAWVEGNLNIASRQDSETEKNKQGSAGVGASVCIPPICYGVPVTASASLSAGNMKSNYQAVTDQSGLFAGNDGYNIVVGANTTLHGAVIASDATADKNLLSTDRLITSDIKNKSDIKSTSVSVSGSASFGGSGGSEGALGGLFGMSLSESDRSKTRSAVSEGTIIVRNAEGANDLVGLNRDTANANEKLDRPDKKAMEERMELIRSSVELVNGISDAIATAKMKAAQDPKSDESKAARQQLLDKGTVNPTPDQIAQQVSQNYGVGSSFKKAAQAVSAVVQGVLGGNMGGALAGAAAPYVAERIKKVTEDDDTANLMAHVVWGAVLAKAQGNSALAGAAGAGLGEYIAKQLYPNTPRDQLTETQKQTISALSTLAGGLAGGLAAGGFDNAIAAAGAAKNAVENNQLSVIDGVSLDKKRQEYTSSCLGVSSKECTQLAADIQDLLKKGESTLKDEVISLESDATWASKQEHKPGDIVMCKTSVTAFCVVTDKSVKTADGEEWYLKPATVEQALEGRADQAKLKSDLKASLHQVAVDAVSEGCGGMGLVGIACQLSMGAGVTNPVTETKATTGERIGWFAQALLNIVGLKAAVAAKDIALTKRAGNGEGIFERSEIKPYTPESPVLGQANEASCAAASCRMAANLGDVPEAYIREAIGTTSEGTALSRIPSGLKELGFGGSAQYTSSLNVEMLNSAIQSGSSVVVSVRAGSGAHAIVIESIKSGRVFIKDPWPVGIGSSYSVPVKSLSSVMTGGGVIIHP
ncbi:two-partner secretion domain-containing protein [Pseudomonas fluorescens]